MATVYRTEAIERHEKDALFSALEAFANLPDMDRKTRRLFDQQQPTFLPRIKHSLVYEGPGYEAELRWYQQQLQKVWSGRDPAGVRVLILLGIETPYQWSSVGIPPDYPESAIPGQIKRDPTIEIDLAAWYRVFVELTSEEEYQPRFEDYGRPDAQFSCSWQRGEITYEFETEFQTALYLLMKESWRAKVCPSCGKYFIADKPPQRHCSSACYGDMKRKRDLDWHRDARREAKRRRKR